MWKLPVVWVCENNGWAMSAPITEHSPTENIADRAAAYGVPGVVVDGQDALAVHRATAEAVERARAGEGPTLIEAKTLRIRGHYEGDSQPYRTDLSEDGPRDPARPGGPAARARARGRRPTRSTRRRAPTSDGGFDADDGRPAARPARSSSKDVWT